MMTKLDLDELERLVGKLSKYRESALAMLNGGVTGVVRQEFLDEVNTIALLQNAAPKLFERVRSLEYRIEQLENHCTDSYVGTLRTRIKELEQERDLAQQWHDDHCAMTCTPPWENRYEK